MLVELRALDVIVRGVDSEVLQVERNKKGVIVVDVIRSLRRLDIHFIFCSDLVPRL